MDTLLISKSSSAEAIPTTEKSLVMISIFKKAVKLKTRSVYSLNQFLNIFSSPKKVSRIVSWKIRKKTRKVTAQCFPEASRGMGVSYRTVCKNPSTVTWWKACNKNCLEHIQEATSSQSACHSKEHLSPARFLVLLFESVDRESHFFERACRLSWGSSHRSSVALHNSR